MKQICRLLIVVSFLFNIVFVVLAQQVSISPASVESPAVGGQFTVSLEIQGGQNVAGYQVTVAFDTSALRYKESANGDYLPAGAFFVPPTVSGNQVTLAATALSGESSGNGTLATLTFEVVAVKASTLTLSEVVLSDGAGVGSQPQVENGQITSPTSPPPPPLPTDTTVSVFPASVQSPSVGGQLTVSLNIANGADVAGYQATVAFDTSALRYKESANGDYLPAGAFFVPPTVSGNQVTLAATALSGESSGNGTLATLTFEVVVVKASTLTLSDVVLSDGAGVGSRPGVENGQITRPTRTPPPPPPPPDTTVSVFPASVQSPAIGGQFTVSLEIQGGQNVAGYQVTVAFDTSALRYKESANGDYLPAGAFFVPPIVSGNQVTLAATALSGESSGNGTLATLTFEVVAIKASTLTLSDVVLSDSAGVGSRPGVENGQITRPPQGRPVNIPDPNLRAKIERTLGKSSGAAITTTDMAALTRLDDTAANISDLTGLEHAINLTQLYLIGHSISDVSALSGLTNLTRLVLTDNNISDLSPLVSNGGLTSLTVLDLTDNNISDLSPLASSKGLTSLTVLDLDHNSISNISALSGLTNLTSLVLTNNSISESRRCQV